MPAENLWNYAKGPEPVPNLAKEQADKKTGCASP